MGNENGYKDYMEGGYDGNITRKSLQALQDREQAESLAQRAEVKMESAWMAERERIAAETGERGAALDAIMNQYLKGDKYQQYLVDGAILRCENATLDDFELPTGEKVVLERITDQSDTERTHIRLCVSENAQGNDPEGSMSVGGLAYATVKDTIKGKNIIPPCCNCKIAADRSAEIARIMADPERRKHGVCIHLMQLNDEWRNLWKPGQSYLSKTNRVPVTLTDGSGEEVGEPETAEGITMTSMLFCRHGGIIMPVTSGQVIETVYDFEKIDKIVEPSGEVWQEETVYVARYVSRCMLDKEYPIEIIAGVVGNIVNEGRFGMFESSSYVRQHIVGGANRTLISVITPLRLCRTGICRRLSAG